MEDIDAMMITGSKFRADGEKYFKLFEPHLPKGLKGNVLLIELGNIDCMWKIMQLSPKAKYFVIDSKLNAKGLQKLYGKEFSIEAIGNGNLDLYNIVKELDMKFDCIIMNPPYQRNLHLKILAEAIKHLKDEKSVCVNLSPSPYTKYKNANSFKLLPCSYERISPDDAAKLFGGIQLQDSLLVSTWQKFKHISLKQIKNEFIPKAYSIIKRLDFSRTFADVNKLNYSNEDFFVPLKLMTARWDKNKNDIIDKIGLISFGKVEDGRPFKEARTKNADRPCGGIPFNTKLEAMNFIDSCRTTFFKFVVYIQHTNSRYVLRDYPFMQDYTKPWDDARFYKFFNITPEEQKVIEETMEKYKQ